MDSATNIAPKTKSGFRFITGDKVLWVILAALAVISILVVYSSSAKMGYSIADNRTATYFLRGQLIVVGGCAVVLWVLQWLNCNFYGKYSWFIYALWAGMTLLPYILGLATNSASRWVLGIQPSEALKISTIIVLARQLAVRQSIISRLRLVPSLNPMRWREPEQQKIWFEGTLPILGPVVAACAIILPAHTSSALLVFCISLIMMYVGRVKRTELLKIAALAFAAGMLLMCLQFGRTGVASGRFSTWIKTLVEQRDEIPVNQLTDSERSMIAIHEGGLFGKGAGHSAVRVEMTHPECDYTFAFFVEEYGLFMALILMSFYLWITVRGMVIFGKCETAFPGLLVLGLVLVITLQALIHILVSVNLFPETGQTLPFVSHGGSSMLFATWAMSIVLSISRQNDEKSHVKPRGESIMERG